MATDNAGNSGTTQNKSVTSIRHGDAADALDALGFDRSGSRRLVGPIRPRPCRWEKGARAITDLDA